jgi:hydroxymethylpyrimidine kinase/phosphomethylpyrimidine kinase
VNIALTIAGSDSGGGAGIQADLKTFHQFGVFGTSVVVAVTAQNTRAITAIHPIPAEIVEKQIEAVAEDLPPAATKTGMLATAELVTVVARGIERYGLRNYVLDPVMVASSGQRLLARDAERELIRLLKLCTVVTPNLDEAAILTGRPVTTSEEMELAGHALVQLGAGAALVTGGHLAGPKVLDVLVTRERSWRFSHPRIHTTSTHGTGCTVSAAVAAGLAQGRELERAVEDALDFVHRAIETAPGLGTGNGPLNYLTSPD